MMGSCISRLYWIVSTEKWIRFPDMREKMLSSMEKQVKIIGASREEIEESLGSPETLESDTISFKIDRKEYPADQVMIYYIGSDYMDVLWLVIVMDENGMSENFFTDVS